MLKSFSSEPPELARFFDDYARTVKQAVGQAGALRGKAAEQRAFAAIESLMREYSWIRTVRFSTRTEDGRGIDLVVETPIGPLYIQVKSSVKGAQQYRKKRRKSKVVVVVVASALSDARLREKMRGALSVLRKQILELRRTHARKRKART